MEKEKVMAIGEVIEHFFVKKNDDVVYSVHKEHIGLGIILTTIGFIKKNIKREDVAKVLEYYGMSEADLDKETNNLLVYAR